MLALPDYAPIEAFLVGRCGKNEREAGLTTYREYQMLLEGKEQDHRDLMEVARWVCFNIYSMNPYIKGTKARNPRSYIRFPWEEMSAEEVERIRGRCHVTAEEQAELDRIFNEVFGNENRGHLD